MALYAYISEECREDIARQHCEQEVERFLAKVRAAQDVRLFDRFPPPYLKKRFERQERLIAELRKVGEHSVVCCLRLLIRGSKEYGRFKRDPVRYGREHFVSLIKEDELEGWLSEQTKVAPAPELARPDGLQMGYLYNVHAGGMGGEQGIMVCESGEWVRRISGAEYANAMKGLVETLTRVVEEGEDGAGCVRVEGWRDIEVVYRMCREEGMLYLAAPMRGGKGGERAELEQRHYGVLAPRDVGKEMILRASARAYPDLLLYDVDIWSEVQRDAEANMALSPEEAELLRSVREPQDDEARYPLFINGRAGSGKSTMLQYLFADYLAYWLREHRDDDEGRPLYLTCSGELLQRSRQVVMRLLERHHTRLVEGNGEVWRELVAGHRKELEEAFEEFHRFMRQRAGVEGFAAAKHIGFSQFRRAWMQHHQYDAQAWKRYGADLSWHVIRTYIKGMSVDGELEPEEYEELPAKQRSVSVERYEEIYEKVWPWYKEKCEREGYWDDQDMVHRILERGDDGRKYPVIFCDEAQDFTHVELMYIYSLSCFSRVRVEGYEIKQVPFAFAGDPFQTLNPTGFRWEATKARFVETVIRALDPEERSGIEDMNYRELTHNYRCSAAITGICNSIQALRAALFDLGEVRPQTTWQAEGESGLAAYYDIGHGDVQEQLRREKDIMVIVPCEAGEEEEYVAGDEVLREIAGSGNGQMAGVVLSAARVKGLEANRVVVYGFGRACPELMKRCIKQAGAEEDYDALLPVQYYLNKVYVAVSRARKRLFVVDTKEGLDSLWKMVMDEQEQKKLIKRLGRDGGRWEGQLGQLQPGLKEYWSEDRENPEDIARRYEEQGRLTEDSYLLRAAARRYEDCGKGKKAGLCRALALWYEGDYCGSGDEYARWEEGNEALRAYWRGEAYGKIRELGQRFAGVRRTLEYELAEMMGGAKVGKLGAEMLQQVAERSERESEMERFAEEGAWGRCVEEIVRRLVREREELEPGPWWAKVSRYGQRLAQCGLPVGRAEIGLFKYMGNLAEEAYALWREEEDVVRQKYGRELSLVRAEVLKYPEVLPDWEYLGRWNEIIAWYEREPEGLSEVQMVSVGRAYEQRSEYERAVAVMSDAGVVEEAMRLFAKCVGRGDDAAFAAGIGVMRALVAKQEWVVGCDILTKERLPEKYRDATGKAGEYIRQQRMVLLGVFVREFAGSKATERMRPEDQDRVTNTLTTYLLSEEMKWRGMVLVDEAGAALEEVARLSDCMKFYEIVMQQHPTEGERKQAQRRWCKCKMRHAQWLKQRGNKVEAEQHERVAKERAHEWSVGALEEIEERVSIVKLDHAGLVEEMRRRQRQVQEESTREAGGREQARRERVSAWSEGGREAHVHVKVEGDVYRWQVGELMYEYALKQRRVNITHQRSYEQSAVKLAVRECVSSDVKWEAVGREAGVMVCKAWHVRCDFRKSETEGIVEIIHLKQGITVNIRM